MSLRERAVGLTNRLARVIAPTVEYAQFHFERHLVPRVASAHRWLDLGCGHKLLPEWTEEREVALVAGVGSVFGIDYDEAALRRHRSIHLTARADIRSLPFRSASFDLVTANMVVEHLDDPRTQFAEVARVLMPGGVFLFHTPNDRSYFVTLANLAPQGLRRRLASLLDGRDDEDIFETHYKANRPEVIQTVAESAGFTIEEVTLVSSVPVAKALPPIALFELLLLRAMERPSLARFRSNKIVALRRTAAPV